MPDSNNRVVDPVHVCSVLPDLGDIIEIGTWDSNHHAEIFQPSYPVGYDFDTMEDYSSSADVYGLMTSNWVMPSNPFVARPYWIGPQYVDSYQSYITPIVIDKKNGGEWFSLFYYAGRGNYTPTTESCNFEFYTTSSLEGKDGIYWININLAFKSKVNWKVSDLDNMESYTNGVNVTGLSTTTWISSSNSYVGKNST